MRSPTVRTELHRSSKVDQKFEQKYLDQIQLNSRETQRLLTPDAVQRAQAIVGFSSRI
jgi:hypothetical protein